MLRVAERCSALQCVAVRCSALQCVAVRCSALQWVVIHRCYTTHWYVWHGSFNDVTWLILMCDMTRSQVKHDAIIWVKPLLHLRLCDMTHSYVWHDSFIRVAWLIHVCDVTHSHVSTHAHVESTCFICVFHVLYVCSSCPAAMEWLPLVASLKW